ncbi:MAG: hypothetical protein WED82_02005 [Balneolales bacterium]
MSNKLTGKQLNELRKRFVISWSCIQAAATALDESGCETDSEALSYAFSEFRAALEDAIPGISPNNEPDPPYKYN